MLASAPPFLFRDLMSATFRPRRSVLFLPGGNPKAISKARTIPADVLVFDLEDAVAPDNKEAARRMAVEAVAARADYGDKELVIRINGLESRWAAGDIAAAVPAVPDAILVPKISRPEDVRRIRAAMRAAGADPSVAIWAMMETPLAILNAGAIGATGADQERPSPRSSSAPTTSPRRPRSAPAAIACRCSPGYRPACSPPAPTSSR